jgi:hypothetical protein
MRGGRRGGLGALLGRYLMELLQGGVSPYTLPILHLLEMLLQVLNMTAVVIDTAFGVDVKITRGLESRLSNPFSASHKNFLPAKGSRKQRAGLLPESKMADKNGEDVVRREEALVTA